MSERLSIERNSHKKRRIAAGAAGGILVTALTTSCTTNPPISSHLPPAIQGPVHGSANGAQKVSEKLDCVRTITYDVHGKAHEQPSSPREIRYFGTDQERIWGAVTTITFGEIKKWPGKPDEIDTESIQAWVVQQYNHNPKLIRYAVGSSASLSGLPADWESLPSLPGAIRYRPANHEGYGYDMLWLYSPHSQLDGVGTFQAPYDIYKHTDGEEQDITQYDVITVACDIGDSNEGAVKRVDIPPQESQYLS